MTKKKALEFLGDWMIGEVNVPKKHETAIKIMQSMAQMICEETDIEWTDLHNYLLELAYQATAVPKLSKKINKCHDILGWPRPFVDLPLPIIEATEKDDEALIIRSGEGLAYILTMAERVPEEMRNYSVDTNANLN